MSKWSDDSFLDMLRQQGEPEADACVKELGLHPEMEAGDPNLRFLFSHMNSNDDAIPDNAPEPVRTFLEKTHRIPAGTDMRRIQRGEKAFMDYASMAAFMMNKSLIEGYASPALTKILHMTGNMERHQWKRSLGVVQMLINVAAPGGFEHGGKAIITAQKMRLLHASMRTLVPKHLPNYVAEHGVPLNQDDNLVSLMGFCQRIIRSLQEVKSGINDEEAEDIYYLWRTYGQLMGIHPPGEPDSLEWLPLDLEQADEYYDSYVRRQYVPKDQNPEGVVLAKADIDMLSSLVPGPLAKLGLDDMPAIVMYELCPEACDAVGLHKPKGHPFLSKLAPKLMTGFEDVLDVADDIGADRLVSGISNVLFSGMIKQAYDGEAWTFELPDTLQEVRDMTA